MAVTDIAAAAQPDALEVSVRSRRLLRAILRNRKATVGALILLLMVFVAAFPGLIANHPPQAPLYRANAGPSSSHLLGTTQLGQDVFSQLVWGTRLTLIVTLVVSAIATLISMIIGVTAAYLGGVTDRTLTVVTDVFLIIPVLPLLILLSAYLSPSVTSLIIGVTAAYLGGVTDRTLTVVTDVFLIIPVLPLLILLSAYLSPSVTSLII